MNTSCTWELTIAKERQKLGPYTFYVPSDRLLKKLKKGNVVKLGFDIKLDYQDEASGERMWVLITERKEDTFVGILDNTPSCIKDLHFGDTIVFETKNIIDTDIEDDNNENIVEKYMKRCFVSTLVFEKNYVGYLYKEQSDGDDDSGWRIFEGSETQENIDNSENIQYISLGAVLNIDDSFLNLIDSPIGASFEKGNDGLFIPITK